VLLLIDVIDDLSFPDNKDLVRRLVDLAKSVAKLKKRCKKAGIPAIYVNDNRGQWRSDITAVVRHCLRVQSPGRKMTKLLAPEADDYVILKPKHSPFYASPLETILDYIGCPGCDRSRRHDKGLRPDRRWRPACQGFQIVRAR
jgi:isochorismate hydrolase